MKKDLMTKYKLHLINIVNKMQMENVTFIIAIVKPQS